jgi:hypothetical protein
MEDDVGEQVGFIEDVLAAVSRVLLAIGGTHLVSQHALPWSKSCTPSNRGHASDQTTRIAPE